MKVRIRTVRTEEAEEFKTEHDRRIKKRIVKLLVFIIAAVAVLSMFLGCESGTLQAIYVWFAMIMGVIIYAALPLIGVCIVTWIVFRMLR